MSDIQSLIAELRDPYHVCFSADRQRRQAADALEKYLQQHAELLRLVGLWKEKANQMEQDVGLADVEIYRCAERLDDVLTSFNLPYVKPAHRDAQGHRTRVSDSSLYDEVCLYCGARDHIANDTLKLPCTATEERKAEVDAKLAK